MAEARQTIVVAIDAQELIGQHEVGETKRREITPEGALGIANNTGIIQLTLNDKPALRLTLREDKLGHAVIEVVDTTRNEKLGVVDVELYGLVPPRRAPEPRKERRFDLDGR